MEKKARGCSLSETGKTPFSERVTQLLNGRSLHAAAKDWDVKVSTLKNYFSRPDSKPRQEVMSKIAAAEGVSIEWLMGLTNERSARVLRNNSSDLSQMSPKESTMPYRAYGEDSMLDSTYMHREPSYFSLLTQLLKMLPDSELRSLTKLLTFKGVGLLRLLLDERNIALLQLEDEEKSRLMALYLAKKGASEDSEDIAPPISPRTGKKVG